MSKSLKKKSHWTSKVHESVIGRSPEGQLGFELKGGAENGQFPYLGEVKPGKVAYESGSKLVSEELLLEVNETPVAGLTIRDVLAVIKHCKDPLRLKCVKQGGIVDKDLRHYLNLRFQKGSVDHELQQIIRDNLYLRTVPCFFSPWKTPKPMMDRWENQGSPQTSLSAPAVPQNLPFPPALHRSSFPDSTEAFDPRKPDPYELYEKSRAIYESRQQV
ncbi:membrane-associated guanylate kinase, WW and PDZ domain-containing protein 2, partial [Cricetulus griseus]|uniref:membrane-associated guanylate kinase, WW and PDZ domain-containing protein 2 n=1 Tax=Cricetulus griseus TaxID=10029 RepID=UPI0015C3D237